MSSNQPTHYGDHQFGIYLGGVHGQRPDLPLRIEDLETRARQTLPPEAYWYVAGGAGETTMSANLAAFDRYPLVPRMLTDVSRRNLSVEVLGERFPHPLMLAPIGVQGIIHEEAEIEVARAARQMSTPQILSTVSSYTMEDVARTLGDSPRWFQLYWPDHTELTRSFLKRAEMAGYSAVVVTLDTKMLAWRERDLEQAYLPFLEGKGLANYFTDPVFRGMLDQPPEEDPWAAIRLWSSLFPATGRTWEDLEDLCKQTTLPIIVKGILHPDDALHAVQAGVDGLIVSNHGGRQVNGAIAALDALPGVVDAVADRADVLFDSGIRRGSDVLKAMALGAKAILLGRPYIWGLACHGSEGVAEVVRRLLADVDLTLGLTGYDCLEQLSRKSLRVY